MSNNIIPYKEKSLKIRNENDLPIHLTFEQFQIIFNELKGYDQILWGMLWETGGRISAVLSIKWSDIDFAKKQMTLIVQKKKKFTTIQIPLSAATINDLRNFQLYAKPKNEDYIFNTEQFNRMKSKSGRLSRQSAWEKVKGWGIKYLNLKNIHPHMLRHGLAVYLMMQNVPMPIISARLGHANVSITQNTYLVVTCDLQRQMTENIQWR